MAATAAQMAAYLYPEEEDPEGAFSWWLKPCGGTDLVPEQIKKIFEVLSVVSDGLTSFKKPKKLKKGGNKKGDDGNPHESDRAPPSTNPPPRKKKCYVAPAVKTKIIGAAAKNTLQSVDCTTGTTHINKLIISKRTAHGVSRDRLMLIPTASLVYAGNARTIQVQRVCSKHWSQACYHYSSAIAVNPQWSTLRCHQSAATTKYRST